MPSFLGFPELVLILVIALIIFGPGKLPSVGASIGRAINEFKSASREIIKDEDSSENGEKEKTSKKETM
ncbi:MAG: twin-arginine translocase TatA/TatE family subunit [Dehalobacterium sp.]